MGEREFAVLFRTYYPVIASAAYNRLNDLADAQDAAAEVFARAWRRRADGEHVFTIAWLYTTMYHVVGNQYRDRDRRARRLNRAQSQRQEPVVMQSDDELDVRMAILRLDPKSRELIWMAYWEDLTREEMAAIVGCTPGRVENPIAACSSEARGGRRGGPGSSPTDRTEEPWTTSI